MNTALQEARAQALWCDVQPRRQPRAPARDAQDEQRRARARAEAEYVRGRAQRLHDHRLSLDSATAAARIRAAAAKQKPAAHPVPQHWATAKRTLRRAAARPPKAEREMAAQEAARRRVEAQERQVERQELLAQRQLVLKKLEAERKGKQAERKRKHEALMLERAAQANAEAEAERKAQRERQAQREAQREAEAQRKAERKAQREASTSRDPLCRGPDGNGNCRHQGIRGINSGTYLNKLCKGCNKDEAARLDRPCRGWQAGGCRYHNQARLRGTLCHACDSAQKRSRKKRKQ